MIPSLPASNWCESPIYLFLLTLFLEPQPVENVSALIHWELILGEGFNEAIERLVADDMLKYLDPSQYVSSTYTVAELKQMLRSRGLRVSGRKAELVSRLVEAFPDAWSVLSCCERGCRLAEDYVIERNERSGPLSGDERLSADSPRERIEWLQRELVDAISESATPDAIEELTGLFGGRWSLQSEPTVSTLTAVATQLPVAQEQGRREEPDAREYLRRGDELRKSGDFRRVVADYNKAIECDPAFVIAYNSRGMAYYGVGEYRKAIADYDKAVELDPMCAAAYTNRGKVYSKLRDYGRAIVDHTRAIEIDPAYAIAYASRGTVRSSLDEYERAIEDFDKAIELAPGYAAAYNNRGNAYYEQGNYERAIVDYSAAIELDPAYGIAYINRGNAYHELGNEEQAIADYSRAIAEHSRMIEHHPARAENYFHRGLVYQFLGEDEHALADYGQALDLMADSATPLGAEIKDRIAKLRSPLRRWLGRRR